MLRFIAAALTALLVGCAGTCEPGEHGWSNDVEHLGFIGMPKTVAPEPVATVERAVEAVECP